MEKSRGCCFLDDLAVAGNIGLLFLDGYINLIETSDCLQVKSLALNTSLSSEGAHGVQGDRPRYIMNQIVEEMSNKDECSSASSEVPRR